MFDGRILDQMKMSVSKPLQFFKCDQAWPMCAFNFTKIHVIPEEFCFKVENLNDVQIFDDYFSIDNMSKHNNSRPRGTLSCHILMERNYHYCRINLFVNTLASMFVSRKKNLVLTNCKKIQIKKQMTLLESHRVMQKFCNFVRN